MKRPVFPGKRILTLFAALSAIALVTAACEEKPGEDRPGITILNGVDGNVSVSAADPPPTPVPTQGPPPLFIPATDVQTQANLGLDMRDILALMAPAAEGKAVDWTAVTAIYDNGRYSKTTTGGTRTFKSIATSDPVLDAAVQAGLKGTERGTGLSDNARRQLVEKGILAITRSQVLTELDTARTKLQQGQAGEAGAAVDAAWGFYVGATDETGARPFLLSSSARKRQANFTLEGVVDDTIQQAMTDMQAAVSKGEIATFDKARAEATGGLNAIFYLGVLRYAKVVYETSDTSARQVPQAEGWAFWQALRKTVESVDSAGAEKVEAIFTSKNTISASAVNEIYVVLNSRTVIAALGIPRDLSVSQPQ